MASIFIYLLIPFVAVIVGFILVAFPYLLYNLMKDMLIKRKIPKDKKRFGEYLEKNREFFSYPGNQQISKKEVEKDEQERFKRFRQFEKLRRSAISQTTTSGEGRNLANELNDGVDEKRGILQDESSGSVGKSGRKVKLD